ncbi:DUF6782 family putative metallopeptidase [Nocardioides daejeonensis]|uniref:DUF6782 family putative metallopeptidase n=1 Tax=Nocardioides daejeonensis TaxID=1046556 RepID=UPI000D74C41E|nr:DUF6782 family putative metallopeptidase [Nocardioides daejeonensis]
MSSPTAGRWLARVAVLTLLALLGTAVGVKVLVDPADDGPPHPDAWDERVLPLVKSVEKLRGLTFKEPVYVDFLSVKEFKKDVRVEQDDLTDEDREELEQGVELLRALGLITGDLDLFATLQDLSSGGTLAYYTPEKERIRIRGKELTPAITSTLVHELTHALQDQHFGLEQKLDAFDDDEGTAAMVFRAVVEGDASRIATSWAQELPAAEQQELQRAQLEEAEQGRKDLTGIPSILVTQMSAPYALGEPLVSLVAAGGNDAVDRLLRSAPRSEEVLLDPFVWGTSAGEVRDVEQPELEKGEKEFDSGEFGALTLFLVLAERLGPKAALAAADGWGGDQYVAYESGGTSCMKATFVGDTASDTVELGEALTTWAKSSPASAQVRIEKDGVHLRACDPGAKADAGSDSSEEALTLVATRAALGAMLATQPGMPVEAAQCVGSAAIEEFTLEELTSVEADAAADLQARMIKMMTGCMG